jgi:transposase
VSCFGAYNVHEDEIFIKCYERKTSREFIDFVAAVRKRWSYVKIKAVIDNVSTHKSKMTKHALKKYKRIECIFLPTSSPKLNPIEGKWDLLQEEAINNQNFESKQELVQAIEGWVEFYNGERKEIYS